LVVTDKVQNDRNRIVVISGPTGIGKSELAVDLAERIGGEIVNLDSVQIYRELNIGAAKPSSDLRMRVPHRGFDVASIAEHYDVAAYRAMATEAIAEVVARGNVPILCGGSTMYLTVLLHGLMQVERKAESGGDLLGSANLVSGVARRPHLSAAELYAELAQRDPVRAAQLHPNDRQRVARAVELLDQGITPSELQSKHQFSASFYDALLVVVTSERAEMYRRIDTRAQRMVDDGLVDETEELVRRFGKVRALTSLGYQQVLDWNRESRAELIEQIAIGTRRYAKRQMTFWRNEPAKRGWRVSDAESARSEALELVMEWYGRWQAERLAGQDLVRVVLRT
jgi:tRNA dimethylallyltransferase